MINVGHPQSIDDIPEIKVYDHDFRICVLQMHRAITDLGLWSQMAHQNIHNSDVIWYHPYVNECDHSGATFALCLKIMQKISSIGWDAFVHSQNCFCAARRSFGLGPLNLL